MSQQPYDPTTGRPAGQPGPTPPPGPAYGAGHPGTTGSVAGDERSMMLIAHLSAPVAMLVSAGWLPFLGPLLVWLFYKDKSQPVRVVSAGAFNFNVSITAVSILTWISVILTLGIGLLWAIPIWIALFVVQLWVHIKGALAASNGQVYDYPFQLRILS